jgi:phosphatidylserine/phosphatidylglycerophosphate/cardiolipin synthase-like enzyme
MSSSPQFRLIDHGWKAEFEAAAKLKASGLLVIAPFIKHRPAQRLAVGKKQIRVLTRYSLRDFLEGVSDLSALRHLLAAGAEVRGIKNLHAKLYVFGGLRAIITSANLTEAALTRNHELGLVTNESALIGTCTEYFERLWALAGKHGKSLTVEMLKKWEAKIAPLAAKKSTAASGLRDYGADLGFMPDPPSV